MTPSSVRNVVVMILRTIALLDVLTSNMEGRGVSSTMAYRLGLESQPAAVSHGADYSKKSTPIVPISHQLWF